MATLEDIAVAAVINLFIVIASLLAFGLLRLQPINDKVYFPKRYLNNSRRSPTHFSGSAVGKFVNLDCRAYKRFLSWMTEALRMTESEIIEHAGLDSAVYLRIYIVGLKIFVPLAVLACAILVPVNATGGTLVNLKKELLFSDIDKLSISNVQSGSQWFWAHLSMAYVFSAWTCFVLYVEYDKIANMRRHFLSSRPRCPNQFTVLVTNVPSHPNETISEHCANFFRDIYPEQYLTHQVVYNANKLAKLVKKKEKLKNWLDYYQIKYSRHTEKRPTTKKGFLGLWGESVDAIDFYTEEIESLVKKIAEERERVLQNPEAIMPAAFVSFNTRCGAAVCAQTQQSRNPTSWLTEWAPEPRDVYWSNLAIPFVAIKTRKLVIRVTLFFLVFFFMIPIAAIQSLANLDGIEKSAPFLKPIIEVKIIKSFIQGFLPGLALKIVLILLRTILMIMSKYEGYAAISILERRTAAKYYFFMLVNVFFGSLVTGTAFQQLHAFLHRSPTQIPKTIELSIPMKATFFITYIMVDGWAGIASEILRLKPLIIFHLKNMFLVKTEKDRENAMDPGSVGFPEALPHLHLYFMLGLVYAVVTPILLPFIVIFFGFAYVVYRHQVINVYNQEYESVASFWPYVHKRIVAALVISQLLLLGVLCTKKRAESTPILLALPVLTIWFDRLCKSRFEPNFQNYPLEEARAMDTSERDMEPNFDLEGYLTNSYLHPIFKSEENEENEMGERRDEPDLDLERNLNNSYLHPIFKSEENEENEMGEWKDDNSSVLTKRNSELNTSGASESSYIASPESDYATLPHP